MVGEMAYPAAIAVEAKKPAAIAAAPRRKFFDREKIAQEKPVYCVFKRAQDIFFSALALIVLAIPMSILALIICIDSPGASPVFKQKRTGLNGKEFTMYKFRTMVPHADEKLKTLAADNEMDGPAFKIREDPRVTRLGHFLRRTSCDELMQFVNVLMGDMSLVGPRPPLPCEVGRYNTYERQRLYVKPGLSCYWQIQPKRNEISFHKWVELDMKYIQDRSFIVDWKIIFKTVKVMFMQEGC